MSPTGPNFPTSAASAAGVNGVWTSPANVEADDGVYASGNISTPGSHTNFLQSTSYGFNLPPTAIIDGIYVEFEAFGSSAGTLDVQIMKAGSQTGTLMSGVDIWDTTNEQWFGYGGSTELWGTTWAYSDINNSGFGFALQAYNTSGGGTAFVDAMRITVYWHTAPADVPKRYIYKVFTNAGAYLGLLPTPSSDPTYSLDINTVGTTLQVEVPVSADTSLLPSSTLTDESGNSLTDESSNILLSDGQPPILSPADGPQALIQNGNHVKIYEYGYWNPQGKCIFQGQIQRPEAGYGGGGGSGGAATGNSGSEGITFMLYSDGSDLNDYMVLGAPTLDQFQLSQNSAYRVPADKDLTANAPGQTITPTPGISGVSQIVLKVAALVADGSVITVNLYASSPNGATNLANFSAGATPDASSSRVITDTTAQNYTFNFSYRFPNGVPSYYVIGIVCDSGSGANIYYRNSNVYARGSMQTSLVANADLYFQTFYNSTSTTALYSGIDPGVILQDVLQNSYSGSVAWNANSIQPTGLVSTYQFNTNTIFEALQAMLSLAPSDFYTYVDLGTNTLYFQESSSTPDITLIKGKHLDQATIITTIENIVNTVYFSGGVPTGMTNNIFVSVSDDTSVNKFGQKLERLSDSNITDTGTALLVAQSYIDQNKDEQNQTTVTIVDKTLDTTTLHPGLMVGFAGFGSFVDSLVLQIVRIDFTPEEVTLTLGGLPRRTTATIQKITSAITAQASLLNPSGPST